MESHFEGNRRVRCEDFWMKSVRPEPKTSVLIGTLGNRLEAVTTGGNTSKEEEKQGAYGFRR